MKTLKPSLVLLSLALFPACAKKHNDPAPQPIMVPPSVVGDYLTQSCTLDARNQGQQFEVNFEDSGRLTQTTQSFNDRNCNESAFATLVKSNYKVEGLLAGSTNVLVVDYAVVEVDMIPYTRRMADEWNRIRFCNIADWKEGNATQVVPENCGTLAVKSNSTVYTLVKIDGNNLFLGVANRSNTAEDGLSPQNRFSQLDTTTAYVKKGTQPLQPTQPDLSLACPALAASYMCDVQGDADFAAADIAVAKAGNEYKLDVTRQNNRVALLDYIVDGQPHAQFENMGISMTTTASCANGDLNAQSKVTDHDFVKQTQDYRFRLLGDGDGRPAKLVIDITRTDGQNPNNAPVRSRIECRAR